MKECKEHRIQIRISESEYSQIRKASERMKLTVSAYMRMLSVSDAEKRNHIADLREKRMPQTFSAPLMIFGCAGMGHRHFRKP